jgi:hypothetical protein
MHTNFRLSSVRSCSSMPRERKQTGKTDIEEEGEQEEEEGEQEEEEGE